MSLCNLLLLHVSLFLSFSSFSFFCFFSVGGGSKICPSVSFGWCPRLGSTPTGRLRASASAWGGFGHGHGRRWLEIYGEASVDVERRLEAKLPEAALRLEDPVALLRLGVTGSLSESRSPT